MASSAVPRQSQQLYVNNVGAHLPNVESVFTAVIVVQRVLLVLAIIKRCLVFYGKYNYRFLHQLIDFSVCILTVSISLFLIILITYIYIYLNFEMLTWHRYSRIMEHNWRLIFNNRTINNLLHWNKNQHIHFIGLLYYCDLNETISLLLVNYYLITINSLYQNN